MRECVVRMEMPENCLKCPLRNQCEIFCDWFWHVVGRAATRKPDPKPFDKGCRIVCQLPEGHGRLVDADELKTHVRNVVKEIVDNSPTIVPADAKSQAPNPTSPLPIRGVEYVPTEVDVQTGTVKYELRERKETCLD